MDLSKILKLLRTSLLAVDSIKNAVKGHVYAAWINEESKFPCITVFFIIGSSPANIDGAVSCQVQTRIWTTEKINPYDQLYGIYADIIVNFHQKHKSNDELKMSVTLGQGYSQHPPIMQETYKNNELYSLPINIFCKAIFIGD